MLEGVEKAKCEPVGKVGGKEAEAGLYVELPTVDFLACRSSSKAILRFPPPPHASDYCSTPLPRLRIPRPHSLSTMMLGATRVSEASNMANFLRVCM
jgi:hypothetical protein